MSVLPKSVEKVIEEFSRLPGVGPKSAARMHITILDLLIKMLLN